MSFLRVFSVVALSLSGISALVLSIALVVVFSIPVNELPVVEAGQGHLTMLSLTYPRTFVSLCWAYSVVAGVASLGLRSRRRWAYYTWLVLLGLLILWSLLSVVSEAANLLTNDSVGSSPGLIPDFAVASAIVAIPLGLGVSVGALLLLRRLRQAWPSQ